MSGLPTQSEVETVVAKLNELLTSPRRELVLTARQTLPALAVNRLQSGEITRARPLEVTSTFNPA